jgi:tRNA(Ile)-lysidine synthase TilS/MesJ
VNQRLDSGEIPIPLQLAEAQQQVITSRADVSRGRRNWHSSSTRMYSNSNSLTQSHAHAHAHAHGRPTSAPASIMNRNHDRFNLNRTWTWNRGLALSATADGNHDEPCEEGTPIPTSARSSSSNSSVTSQQHKRKHNRKDHMNAFLQKIHWSICNDILPQSQSDSEYGSLQVQAADVDVDVEEEEDPRPIVMLLGVSGGMDSIALFHSILEILHHHRPSTANYELQWGENRIPIPCQLHVVHFDHGQRGKESDGDRLLVEELCEKHNVDFHCFYWGGEMQKNKQMPASEPSDPMAPTASVRFSQEIARDWRRSQSIQLIQSIIESNDEDDSGAGACTRSKGLIFTAHHKDDSEETMLLKILRGVHITNISGMEPVQPAHHVPNANANANGRIHNIYFAKPMLRVRKTEISDYLTSHNHTWREDGSNASGKYLRNRVRNELIPLLNDMVGGKDVLESRLDNMEEQSRKLKVDVSDRANHYLNSFGNESSEEGHFVLPSSQDQDKELNVVEEEALYKWVCQESNGSANLSYDKLRAICQQISAYPRRRQWKISIGDGWVVERNGDILFLSSNKGSPVHLSAVRVESKGTADGLKWDLKVADATDVNDGAKQAGNTSFNIKVAISTSDLSQIGTGTCTPEFSLKMVQNNESLRFVPPWRKGKNEMKIKEFLRGQKVPLHRRTVAPIICLHTDVGDRIVAVFVENLTEDKDCTPGRWITNAAFDTGGPSEAPLKKVEHIIVTKLQ